MHWDGLLDLDVMHLVPSASASSGLFPLHSRFGFDLFAFSDKLPRALRFGTGKTVQLLDWVRVISGKDGGGVSCGAILDFCLKCGRAGICWLVARGAGYGGSSSSSITSY